MKGLDRRLLVLTEGRLERWMDRWLEGWMNNIHVCERIDRRMEKMERIGGVVYMKENGYEQCWWV